MPVTQLTLGHPRLVGFEIHDVYWIFASDEFKPSYWLILKREGFSGDVMQASEELDMLTWHLELDHLNDIYRLEAPAPDYWFTDSVRTELEQFILSGRIQVFKVDEQTSKRLADRNDPIYSNPTRHDQAGDPIADKRNELAEELGSDIVTRWIGKDKADQLHWDRWGLWRETVEVYDVGAEVVDTVVDLVVGLWDIVKLVVTIAGDTINFALDAAKAAYAFQQKVLSGDVDAIKQDLENMGIAIGNALDSAEALVAKAREGLMVFNRIKDDPVSRQLIIDYLDSLYQSIEYRDSRTIGIRVFSEIGVEVLLAFATGGAGNVARRAGQASAKTAKVARAASATKRIGPFTVKAIDDMVDLAKMLDKPALKIEKPPMKVYPENLPNKPKPDVDAPEAKTKPKPDPDVTELEPGAKGSWNKQLNGELTPNHKYKVGSHTYETDDMGRVKRVSGDLDLNTRDRNTYQQGKSAKLDGIKDGLDDDDGGHLVASIFDGPGEQINYAPMNSNLNRGAWKRMENDWANALKEGKQVNVDIQPIYDGASKRPTAFEVLYDIDGEEEFVEFANKAGG